MQIYLDGQWLGRDDAKISVFDHGLLYGDGVFEGIRMYRRRIFRLREHLQRLYDSARAICLQIPLPIADLAGVVEETCRRNRQDDAYIRLVVTRGVGPLGIDPRTCPNPSIIVIVTDVNVYSEELYASGIRLVTAPTRQIAADVFDPRIKSLNYLKNVLGKIDAHNAGAHEAILLNPAGFIAECTADNLFIVRNDRLLTPHVHDGALAGITRAAVLELAARADLPAEECHLARYDVFTADECFVTGTGAEIMHVREADGRRIGSGSIGPHTHALRSAFERLVVEEGEPLW